MTARVRQCRLLAARFSFPVCLTLASSMAAAQALTVLPVNIQMPPGQKATTLTVINQGDAPTSIQIRAFAWGQIDGRDELTSSNAILISPPLATIAPGATQIVRLVLRHPSEKFEDNYRIILDQIPPPSEPGVIHVVLRMSIPIFVQPKLHATSHVQFRLERRAGQMSLVASNDGAVHESLQSIDLWTQGGVKLKTDFNGSQYILAGGTRRWTIPPQDPALVLQDSVRLTATGLNSPIKQQVQIVGIP